MTSYYQVRYHSTAEEHGLPAGREYVFPGFFLTWLALNDRLSNEFLALVGANVVDEVKARRRSGPQLLEAVDGTIDAAMMSDDDTRWFAQSYFSLIDGGHYIHDFCTTFGVSPKSEKELYSVSDSWENYERIASAIEVAFAAQEAG